ncbi:MAG TPA: hypothetical protein DCS07_12610 [Bdellovibrionales bacterium]|nr:MAG: hypothetical protein A2Z97_08415 [Bdellovibrionales bacterium GWB1_52_6]OFZ33611.1 MAG: hypothetical protein A2070_11550 [Bdellovibrionales bacterium GWC1_52_8]HAR43452.1 hypothetical protein [Bdellovibrionales bacterium]HCM39456.1 hypothetical protein [Bdellovibrionales bacterium]
MDEKQMALNQIKAIHEVMYSGDRLTGSPTGLFVTGATSILCGIIVGVAKLQETGWIGIRIGSPLIVLALVAALVVNLRSRHSVEEMDAMKTHGAALHPLIKQSFGIAKAILIAGFGLTLVWWMHLERMFAMWMIFNWADYPFVGTIDSQKSGAVLFCSNLWRGRYSWP